MSGTRKTKSQGTALLLKGCLCFFLLAPYYARAAWLVEPPLLELGEIVDTDPVTINFRIRNTGTNLIRVADVELSDPACMEYALSDHEIGPDGSVVMQVHIHPFGYGGVHEFKATVSPDRSDLPLLEPMMRATVLPRIPAVVFDDLFAGEVRTHEVRLARAEDHTSLPVRVETDYVGIQASVSPLADDRYRILITTVPPQPLRGEVRCRVLLFEEEKDEPVVAIPVWMEVLPDLVVAPDSLHLEASNREQFRILFIRQNPQAPARLPEVFLPDERFRAEIVPEYELSNWRINLHILGMGGEVGEVGRILLRFDGEGGEELSVPVRVHSSGHAGSERSGH